MRCVAADMLGIEFDVPSSQEGSSAGAAMLAMAACGDVPTVEDAERHCAVMGVFL